MGYSKKRILFSFGGRKMKLIMIIADYFEDTEAIATLDVLMRGNINVDLVSLMGRNKVLMKSGIEINIPLLYENINVEEYDGIIIPGGPASFKLMPSMKSVSDLIDFFANNNKLVAAICAAPSVLGENHILEGKRATCHPGFEEKLLGAEWSDQPVVVDGNVITSRGMGTAIAFGLEIVRYFTDDAKVDHIRQGLVY